MTSGEIVPIKPICGDALSVWIPCLQTEQSRFVLYLTFASRSSIGPVLYDGTEEICYVNMIIILEAITDIKTCNVDTSFVYLFIMSWKPLSI